MFGRPKTWWRFGRPEPATRRQILQVVRMPKCPEGPNCARSVRLRIARAQPEIAGNSLGTPSWTVYDFLRLVQLEGRDPHPPEVGAFLRCSNFAHRAARRVRTPGHRHANRGFREGSRDLARQGSGGLLHISVDVDLAGAEVYGANRPDLPHIDPRVAL